MSSSSSRAVSMMIGTELARAQTLADLEPVEPRQHDVEHDQVDGLLARSAQRLFAVARRDDAETVALERIRQELLDGVLVVDEEDGRGVGHRRLIGRVRRPSYYSPRMSAAPPTRRRRRRRGVDHSSGRSTAGSYRGHVAARRAPAPARGVHASPARAAAGAGPPAGVRHAARARARATARADLS